MPKRIQRKRTKGWRMPEGAVYVGRPTRFGNPLRIGQWRNYGAGEAVRDYQRWLRRDPVVRSYENAYGLPPTPAEIRAALRGKDLACWCPLDQPCHADILLKLANRPPPGEITLRHLSLWPR